MRIVLALLLVGVLAPTPVLWADTPDAAGLPEQVITPIDPGGNAQDVEWLAPEDAQRIEAVDADEAQRIASGQAGTGGKAASTAGKVVLGIVSAALSVGFLVASILFI